MGVKEKRYRGKVGGERGGGKEVRKSRNWERE